MLIQTWGLGPSIQRRVGGVLVRNNPLATARNTTKARRATVGSPPPEPPFELASTSGSGSGDGGLGVVVNVSV